MASIYGSQGNGIAANAFIWASQIKFTIPASAANIAGLCYYGTLPMSCLLDDEDSVHPYTFKDLMDAA
jgi:hypothetical protein